MPRSIEAKPSVGAAPQQPDQTEARSEPKAASGGTLSAGELWEKARASLTPGSFSSVWLEMFECLGLERDRMRIAVRDESKRRMAEAKLKWLGDLISKAAGRRVHVRLDEGAGGNDESESGPANAALIDTEIRREAMKHPVVQRAMELFDAQLIEAKREESDDV